ncbi:MAG: putative glycosyl transferase [Lentisphaerae bacterium ADurb.BinA184]|nr:MAG: putative glycosyl transferase [Lentisphaerae bacterium ADurb.BinA184]
MAGRPDILYLGRSRANLIQTFGTVEGFEELGVRVELWLPAWPRGVRLADKAAELGVSRRLDVRGSGWLHPRWGFWPFVLRHWRHLAQAGTLYTRVPEISAVLAAFGLRHHLEVHDVASLLDGRRGRRLVARHRRGTVDMLIPISHGARQALVEAGAVGERMHVAPSGVRLSDFAGVSRFDPGRLARPRIVHIGRLTPERGSRVLAALAGQDGCEVTAVGGEESLPGVRNVPMVPLREVPAWYDRCDVILLPYQPEIGTAATMSPIKLFESLAAGRPIVASDLPTLREILTPEQTALLVPPRDVEAWVAAVRRLRQAPSLAARLAGAARELAPAYSWRARAQGILKAIGLPVGEG